MLLEYAASDIVEPEIANKSFRQKSQDFIAAVLR